MVRTTAAILSCAVIWLFGAAPGLCQPTDDARLAALVAEYLRSQDPLAGLSLAEAYAAADRRGPALRTLEAVAARKAGLYPWPRGPMRRYADDPAFKGLLDRMRTQAQVMGAGETAFVLDRPGLVPEGVAWDPASNRLFVGDTASRAILSVGPGGEVAVFASGLALRPLGLRVDTRRGLLWAATHRPRGMTDGPWGQLLAFDLKSGALVRRHEQTGVEGFNDLDVSADGAVFATDSAGGAIWRLSPAGVMERLIRTEGAPYPNGIAISPDGGWLYLAHFEGLARVSIATGALEKIDIPAGLALSGVDGVYLHRGDLIAVQNFTTAGRVLRLDLDDEGRTVTGYEILASARPEFEVPTTAALHGDRLYILANAQVYKLRGDDTVEPGLRPAVILDFPLKP